MHLQQTWAHALDRIDRYHREAEGVRLAAAWPQQGMGRRRVADGLRGAARRLARFADRIERRATERLGEVDHGASTLPGAGA